MIKRVYALPMISALAFTLFLIFSPQMGKAESPGIITLPSGEKVCDLNGDWDALFEHYGTCMNAGSWKAIVKIKQEGNRFVGTKLSGGPPDNIGNEVIRGEVDQKGYKKGEIYMRNWRLWAACKGKITDSCKKILMDEGSCVQVTLERK